MDPNYETPKYSKVDSVFAWLSLILAFFFCHTVPVWENPLGGVILIFALFITGFIVLRAKKAKLRFSTVASSISALILSFAFLLAESRFLLFLSCSYCLASYAFLIYAAFGNRVENGFSDYIYIDYCKALCILPFCAFVSIFPALASKSANKGSSFILKVIIGIAIAVIPTALVFAFLSYDEGFMKILDGIFSFNPDNGIQWFMSICYTLPLAMYGYGLYTASRKGLLKDKFTAEKCDSLHKKIRVLPQITAVVATLPIVFLYVVFFISQWKYFISGFTGILPEGFSYAEYARQGFFELCSVSVINLVCIIAIGVFIGRGKKNKAAVLKLLTTVFCLCTLILISTAVAKLVMYIDYYGLTEKRIYAMWLMAVIAVVFLVIALGQFISKVRIVAVSCTVVIAMFIPLALCNINAITAQYNTERYLAGTIEEIDTEHMAELGDSAIPSLVKLATTIDPEKEPDLKHRIDTILFDKKVEIRDENFALFAFSVPSSLAKAAVQDYQPVIPVAGTYRLYRYDLADDSDSDWEYDTDNYYYKGDELAPIMTIHADRTGTFVYKEQSFSVQVDGFQIIIDGEAFDMTYAPFGDSYCDLELDLVTEDDRSCNLRLDIVECDAPPAGTYGISSVEKADGSILSYDSATDQIMTVDKDGKGSFHYDGTLYSIAFENKALTINGEQIPCRYTLMTTTDDSLLTLYWFKDGVRTITLHPVS